MAERSRFFSRRAGDSEGEYTYSAEDFAEYLATFFSTGVVGSVLQVIAANNAITVSPGCAIVNGHWYINDSTLTLGNPVTPLATRKDTIVVRLDKESRKISIVWLTGLAASFPRLQSNDNICDIPLSNVEVLAGGVVKSCTDKRVYASALYSINYENFRSEWNEYMRVCKQNYNQVIATAQQSSEIISARGGYGILSNRHVVDEAKFDDITEPGTTNLFDKIAASYGWIDDGELIMDDKLNYTSDYISTQEGETLYFWDSNGKEIKADFVELYRAKSADSCFYSALNVSSYTNTSRAKYIRACFSAENVGIDNLQITNTPSPPTKYTPFQRVIKSSAIANISNTVNNSIMCYITKNVSIFNNSGISVNQTDIASSSPVSIQLTGGPGGTKWQRLDGTPLYVYGTKTEVVTTYNAILVSSEDLVAGITLTTGGAATIRYYNAPCTDLIALIGSQSKSVLTTSEPIVANTNSVSAATTATDTIISNNIESTTIEKVEEE